MLGLNSPSGVAQQDTRLWPALRLGSDLQSSEPAATGQRSSSTGGPGSQGGAGVRWRTGDDAAATLVKDLG
jgi:hypothetical protein